MKLEPCPFCGNPAIGTENAYGSGYMIGCSDDCIMSPYVELADKAEAIAAWNRRTPPTSQSDEALVEAVNDYNSVLRSCSQVAKRKGENTNWDALGKRITRTLEKHHYTWLTHWDGKIS